MAREAAEARRPILRLPLEGVPPDELLKQLELLKRQEEAHFTSSSSGSRSGGRPTPLMCLLWLLACLSLLNVCVELKPRLAEAAAAAVGQAGGPRHHMCCCETVRNN